MSKVELPAELKGKTPEEVAAYYQNLVGIQKKTYEQALDALGGGAPEPKPGPKPNTPEPKKVTTGEFLADPSGSTRDLIQQNSVSREEWNAATAQARESFTYTARERAMKELNKEADKNGDSFDWDRMEPVLLDIAKKMDPMSLTNPDTWKTMYYYNRGQLTGTLVKEGVQKATMPMEPVGAGGSEPPVKKPLSAAEKTVAEGLGLTEDTYRDGARRMANQDFPLTMDNRNRR